MNEFDRLQRMAEMYRRSFPPGTRVLCVRMFDPRPVPPNTEGTVIAVDDIGQIHVKWDNGSSLALNPECDTFRKIKDE